MYFKQFCDKHYLKYTIDECIFLRWINNTSILKVIIRDEFYDLKIYKKIILIKSSNWVSFMYK